MISKKNYMNQEINKKNFMNLDRIKLGENKFAESTNDNQFNTSHSAICNGCRGWRRRR